MDTTNKYTCYQCKKLYDSTWSAMLYNNNKFCSGFCLIDHHIKKSKKSKRRSKKSNKFSSYESDDLSSLTDKIENIKLQ